MLYDLVVPLGIITISCMLITAFLGMRILKIKAKTRLLLHKIMALTTVTLALIHGGIVIYFKFFY